MLEIPAVVELAQDSEDASNFSNPRKGGKGHEDF